ncbi:MAG: hypothetical protein U0800_25660 [Isosphaeraceae bacterium]
MAIQVVCEACSRELTVPEEHAGKRGKCRHCGTSFTVPGGRELQAFDDAADPRGMALSKEASRDGSRPEAILRETVARSPAAAPIPRDGRDQARTRGPGPWWIGLACGIAAVAVISVVATVARKASELAEPSSVGPEAVVPGPNPSAPAEPLAARDSAGVAPAANSPAFALEPPPLEAPIPEDQRARIAELEAKLAADPGAFDYRTHNELRHLYFYTSCLKRSAYHCEAMLAGRPYDRYALDVMGASSRNGPRAPAILLERADQFPEYRRSVAACRLKAAELLLDGDPKRAEELLASVERMGARTSRLIASECPKSGGGSPP